jgi:hypothetical protein
MTRHFLYKHPLYASERKPMDIADATRHYVENTCNDGGRLEDMIAEMDLLKEVLGFVASLLTPEQQIQLARKMSFDVAPNVPEKSDEG